MEWPGHFCTPPCRGAGNARAGTEPGARFGRGGGGGGGGGGGETVAEKETAAAAAAAATTRGATERRPRARRTRPPQQQQQQERQRSAALGQGAHCRAGIGGWKGGGIDEAADGERLVPGGMGRAACLPRESGGRREVGEAKELGGQRPLLRKPRGAWATQSAVGKYARGEDR
jgi:hypothetical protein